MAVEAEEPDGLFGVVKQDQRHGIGPGGPDGQGRLDRLGQLREPWRPPGAAAP